MKFFTQVGNGIQCYGKALLFVKNNGMSRLMLLSCLCYLLIIAFSAWLIWQGIDSLVDRVFQWSILKSIVVWAKDFPWILALTKIGIYLSSFLLFISLYKYLFLVIASPLYAYISERTSESINNTHYPFVFSQFLHDIGRGIIISIKNFISQLFITLIFYMLSFIPLLGILFALAIILTDCYYYGFSMLDYNCERDKMSVKDSRFFIKKHSGLAIGNGLIMYLSFSIPLIGVMIIAPLSAVAAGISYYDLKNKIN